MSDIKKLFNKESNKKILSNQTGETLSQEVESERLVDTAIKRRERFLTHVRYHPASASNFAIYGSAKKYYEDAISYIAQEYPYDGSAAEKNEWHLSASQLDLYIFNEMYPKTTGYVTLSSDGWGTRSGAITSDYGTPSTTEYIQIKGSLNTGSADTMVEHFHTHKPGVGSNIYETAAELSASHGTGLYGSREANLKTDLDEGVTIEFWLKKSAFDVSKTTKEVVFDLWNGRNIANADYGRLIVELKGDAGASPFVITCASGSDGFTRQTIGISPTTTSVQSWNHYAISVKNHGDNVRTRLYINGSLDDEKLLGTDISEITGSLVANIGALRTSPVSGVSISQGSGKLIGSIDEFRFWKTERTHKEVGRHYWTQVNGGTNTDPSNTDLGLYYKFNEGTTGYAEIDQVVLDYSGRITNGYWYGYPGSAARASGSAIVESSTAPLETADPIIHAEHPDVITLKSNLAASGSLWDDSNNSLLYNSMPAWIFEYQEEKKSKDLENLVQTMASYFDKLHGQIANVNRLKNVVYPSSSVKPLPFANKLIEHMGLSSGELFENVEIIEKLLARSETQKYDLELHDIKNSIYQNVYNNLSNIYKSKGTEKSFRNLIRCFGVDDEILKLNLYGDNITYKLRDNYKTIKKTRKYANFNVKNRFDATVYQYTESGNSNSVNYITGSDTDDREAYLGMSMEVEALFPKKFKFGEPGYFKADFTDVSIFGSHTVGSDDTSYTTPTPDPAAFHVMAVKTDTESKDVYFKLTSPATSPIPELTSSVFGNVYDNEKWNFALRIKPDSYPIADGVRREFTRATATFTFSGAATVNSTIALTSHDGTFKTYKAATNGSTTNGTVSGSDILYNAGTSASTAATNLKEAIEHGNGHAGKIAVIANSSAGVILATQKSPGIAGNTAITTAASFNSACSVNPPSFFTGATGDSYTLEFRGVANILDTTYRQFSLTSSLTAQEAINFLSSSKRVFIGAHRTDFTGTLLTYSDAEIGNVRYWGEYVDDETFMAHVKDLDNYGTKNPYKNITLLNTESEKYSVPQTKALLLNWDFDTLNSSDGSGTFTVPDASSGSATSVDYGWFGDRANKQHTARGYGFANSSDGAIRKRQISSAKQQLPEVLSSADMIEIRNSDDEVFTKDHRPIQHYFAIEKSMYQTISEEMLNMFATIVDFNNLIGRPVNKYRQEYKELEKLRQMFFERVENTPELDKYIDFYKWIDSSINTIITALIPASSDASSGMKTVIESHILERNKYWNKFPTLEMKAEPPTAGIHGINEALYSWRHGHRSVSEPDNQDVGIEWWSERAERAVAATSGDAEIDSAREEFKDLIGRHRNETRRVSTLAGTSYSGSTFAISRFSKPYRMVLDESTTVHGGANVDRKKNLDILKAATTPLGPENNSGFPVNVVIFDDIYVDKTRPHRVDLDPSRAVSGKVVTPSTGSIFSEYPHNKTKYSFKGRLLRDYGFGKYESGSHPPDYHTVMPGEMVAPFSIYGTDVTNTYHEYIQSRLFPNITLTNLHSDTYGISNEQPIQGPFTNAHVGGRQNRHVPLNKGGDNFDNRPEAWKILIGPTSASAAPVSGSPWFVDPFMLGVVGPDYPWPPMSDSVLGIAPYERPRATLLRDETAKRPLNLRNIKYTTGSAVLGNYRFDHNIVQVPGRHINNSAMVYAGGWSTGSIPAAHMTVHEYTKPERPRNEHVIVSRFSAPGGPAQAGDSDAGYGLDVESAQFSIHDTLNYRNLLVRGAGRWPNGQRELLTNHTKQFGFFSDVMNIKNGAAPENIFSGSVSALDYTGRLNYHKTNRNTRRRVDFGNPICYQDEWEFNRKAAEWPTDTEQTQSCAQYVGYASFSLPAMPATGPRIDVNTINYTDKIDTDPISGNKRRRHKVSNKLWAGTGVINTGDVRGFLAQKGPNPNAQRNLIGGAARRKTDKQGREVLDLPNKNSPNNLKDNPNRQLSLNAFMEQFSVSVWTWPSNRPNSHDTCKRAIFSIGSGNTTQQYANASGVNIPVDARRVAYLTAANKVRYEASYLVKIPLSGLADSNLFYWGTSCGIWETQQAVTEEQWSNIIVTHNTTRISDDGTPFGPDIYINGTKQVIATIAVPAVDSFAVSPENDSYIGRATDCEEVTHHWNGYMDEFSLWPIELDQAAVDQIYSAPYPSNLADHTDYNSWCAIWYRMGDGQGFQTGTIYPDAIDGSGASIPQNCWWDLSVLGGHTHATPSQQLSQTFVNVSNSQSSANKRLPGQTYFNEVCQYSTGSLYDNWYVTHELPRSSAQYTWISGSVHRDRYGSPQDGNGEGIFGHTHPSGLVPQHPQSATGSSYVPAIMFSSASEAGSVVAGGQRKFGVDVESSTSQPVYTPYNSLKTNIAEPLSASDNTLGYPMFDTRGPDSIWSIGHTAVNATDIVAYINKPFVPGGPVSYGGSKVSTLLNAILLKRQGPYGWPSWKQIRGAEHPASIYQRRNNILSVVNAAAERTIVFSVPGAETWVPGAVPGVDASGSGQVLLTTTVRGLPRGDTFTNYTEPPIVNNHPLRHILNDSTVTSYTYRNNTCKYSNEAINNKLGISDSEPTMYDSLVSEYTKATKTAKLVFNYLAYKEDIYPQEINKYNNIVRSRQNFQFDWSRDRKERSPFVREGSGFYHPKSNTPVKNSQGWPYRHTADQTPLVQIGNSEKHSYSIWPLDSTLDKGPFGQSATWNSRWPIDEDADDNNILNDIPFQTSVGRLHGNGELQNYTVQLRGGFKFSGSAQTDSLVPAAQYARRHTIPMTGSGCQWRYGTRGMNSILKNLYVRNDAGSRYGRKFAISGSSLDWYTSVGKSVGQHMYVGAGVATIAGDAALFGGETPWEIPAVEGKYPFYNNYEDYAYEDIRLKAKDHSIVPEFRISEHIDYYISRKGGDFLSSNTGSLSLTGSSYANSGEEDFFTIYSNSDFMKKFGVIDKDHEAFGGAQRIELNCSAYLKLLPYNGFYPAQRTVQLANLFSQSYGPSMYRVTPTALATTTPTDFGGANSTAGTGAGHRLDANLWSIYMRPYFAPGIMFNSIKSGIAVDYPIMTGSFGVTKDPNFATIPSNNPHGFKTVLNSGMVDANDIATTLTASGYYLTEPRFHHRIPFEAIVNPDKYITDLSICNMEPHPSGAFGLHLTASVGSAASPLYRMAANNFFAEVPEFFLEKGNLSSIASLPESDSNFGTVGRTDILIGRKFCALVKLRKSTIRHDNFNPLSASWKPSNAQHGTFNVNRLRTDDPVPHPWRLDVPTINMYSRPSAFGPPSAGLWGSNAGFNMPFTPPYYDGAAWAYLEFDPVSGSKKYDLDEILANTKVIYTRAGKQAVWQGEFGLNADDEADEQSLTTTQNWPWSRPAKADATSLTDGVQLGSDRVAVFADPYPQGRTFIDDNAMQITASVNLFQKSQLRAAEYNAISGKVEKYVDKPESKLKSWVIQTKFETPILNFLTSGSTGAGYAPEATAYGMWHQYGNYPEDDNTGVFLEITDVSPDFLTKALGKSSQEATVYGSLADLVGFNTEPKKLGVPATEKKISEAIIAAPFIEKDGERHFFEIPREKINSAKLHLAAEEAGSTFQSSSKAEAGDSIIDMVEKMQRFVFPPKMSFLENDEIQPFAMYVFEFSTTLDREDLTDIWQNVQPKIARNFEHQTATVAHELTPNELMGCDSTVTGKKLQDKLQWMVFKVKQKAQKNYLNKVVGSSQAAYKNLLSDFIKLEGDSGSKLIPLDYTYNWPYDFFSLVELAKIDSTVEYGDDPAELVELSVQKRFKTATDKLVKPGGPALIDED